MDGVVEAQRAAPIVELQKELCWYLQAPNELVALKSNVVNFGGNCRASRLARLVELDSSTYISTANS